MRESKDKERGLKGIKHRFLIGIMGANIYIMFTVSLQEIYKNDFSDVEAGISGVVAWCSALMIAIILFLLAQHRKFDHCTVSRRLALGPIYVGLSVALGIVTGYVAPPVFIRDQHIEFWGLYTLGTTALLLAATVMLALDGKRANLRGPEKSE